MFIGVESVRCESQLWQPVLKYNAHSHKPVKPYFSRTALHADAPRDLETVGAVRRRQRDPHTRQKAAPSLGRKEDRGKTGEAEKIPMRVLSGFTLQHCHHTLLLNRFHLKLSPS